MRARRGSGKLEETHLQQCRAAWGCGGRAASALPRTRAGRLAPSATSVHACRTRSSRPAPPRYRAPSASAAAATPSAGPGCRAGTSPRLRLRGLGRRGAATTVTQRRGRARRTTDRRPEMGPGAATKEVESEVEAGRWSNVAAGARERRVMDAMAVERRARLSGLLVWVDRRG